ncbi:homoserine kinase [Rhabdaerophilum calidifontis]|uniref:homoserine kinase n=1 Tax=Rhabdaerophilum calidifontis TaxID=2604328 RepID=UPI001239135E|nr:homoserine kinase [Rhabdaerophilum calidifontis]
MAVYTDISAEELVEFLKAYDLGPLLSFKGIAEGVENSNYLIETGGGRYILTLYEKRVKPEEIPFFLGLMGHLADRGINCPLPVKAHDGQALRVLAGRPAAIVTFLEGVSYRRPSVAHCGALGGALAGLHEAARGFGMSRANALSVAGWRPLAEAAGERAESIAPGLAIAIRTELADLEVHWPRNLEKGIIHADLFPNNVLFVGDQLSGLIDFYFAAEDAFAYDLAICLNAWCFEPDFSFNLTKGRAMIAGYRARRALNRAEIEALPILCRGAAMRFLLTRLVDWLNVPVGALVRPLDPMEYFKKLRFHQGVQSATAYGLME